MFPWSCQGACQRTGWRRIQMQGADVEPTQMQTACQVVNHKLLWYLRAQAHLIVVCDF